MSEPRTQDTSLDMARTYWRQGLLREAEQALKGVTAGQPVAERASAQVLTGNIAYERGEYRQAVEAWQAALDLYASDGGMESSAQAVADNLAMGEARIARRAELEQEARHLAVQLAAVLLLAVAAFAIGCRMSRRRGNAAPG